MNKETNDRYREIFISPIRECADYTPKFGHSGKGVGFEEFQTLYGNDRFYNWIGLNNSLMYAAHKAAGGITSIYRQIGIGSERLIRQVFIDYLGLDKNAVKWSYQVEDSLGKKRTLSLDGRIVFNDVKKEPARSSLFNWKDNIAEKLSLSPQIKEAMTGVVFEIRQGYKSKDSKRQNADIANASNAYANGYIPCLMVMSSQIDDDIVSRYTQAKWLLLKGEFTNSPCTSTFDFLNSVVGFKFTDFMDHNQDFFRNEMNYILERLINI